MKSVAQILVAFLPIILAGVIPFIRILRGGRILVAFAVCWLLLVAWMFIFSLLVPLAVAQFDLDVARVVSSSWVPEGPAVTAMAFFGWGYAGIIVGLALLVKRIVTQFRLIKSC